MIAEPAILQLVGAKAVTPSGRPVFQGVDLAISKGEVVGIVGPSGIGKTTLLELIAEHDINAGQISAERVERPKAQAGRGPVIGFVPQGGYSLFIPRFAANATVRAIFCAFDREGRENALAELDRLLAAFALSPRHVRAAPVTALSGGEVQRVALALTLSSRPDLWIADEPTASLDRRNIERLASELCNIRAERRTAMLIASHDEEFLSRVSDRVLQLSPNGLRPSSLHKINPQVHDQFSAGATAVQLALRNVSHAYSGGHSALRRVFSGFSAEFLASKSYALVGRSGIGKSTLLRLAAGFEKPWKGHVERRWHGTRMPPALLVPQDGVSFFNPVQSIGDYASDLARRQGDSLARDGLASWLEVLRLDADHLGMLPLEPSGGEIRRLAVAVGLWIRPQIICLDEVDAGLGKEDKDVLAGVVRRFASHGDSTVILATHDVTFAQMASDVSLDLEALPAFLLSGS